MCACACTVVTLHHATRCRFHTPLHHCTSTPHLDAGTSLLNSVTVTSGMSKRHLPKVTAFSIVLVASAFNPERFLALAGLMAKQYASTGQPTRLLETYLSVFTSQRASFGDVRCGTWCSHMLPCLLRSVWAYRRC